MHFNLSVYWFREILQRTLQFLFALLLLGGSPAFASHQSRTMVLDQTPKVNLAGHLSVFRDSSKHMSVEMVADPAQDHFSPLKNNIAEGFTSDVVWIGFTLAKSRSTVPNLWWLELAQPLLFNSVLYERTADGQYREVQGILNQSIAPNTNPYQRSIFELKLTDTHPHSFYLRVQSVSSISSELTLSQPGEFVASNTMQRFFWGSAYGAHLILILFFAGFSIWTRDRTHGLYTVYFTVLGVTSFYSGAWPMQFFPHQSVDSFYKTLGIAISLAPTLSIAFSASYLKLTNRWQRVLKIIVGITAVCSVISVVMVLDGHFGFIVPRIQIVAMLIICLISMIALIMSIKGNAVAQQFLISFGFFYLGSFARILKNAGIIESNFWTENGYQIGTLMHMLLMGGSIVVAYSAMREDKRKIQFQLENEIILRKEQAEFMSMVSHEFRTPMAIISASAENLLNDTQLLHEARRRVEKISRANARLTGLMKDYLEHEQHINDANSLLIEIVELNDTLQNALKKLGDFNNQPRFEPSQQPIMVKADEYMIQMVCYSLISNAHRYAPNKTPVIRSQINGSWGEFTVFNDGPGIPEQDLPHIFKKFFRGSNAAGTSGTGLGLYFVQWIIEKHKGQVLARNLASGGCEFLIRLPLQTLSKNQKRPFLDEGTLFPLDRRRRFR